MEPVQLADPKNNPENQITYHQPHSAFQGSGTICKVLSHYCCVDFWCSARSDATGPREDVACFVEPSWFAVKSSVDMQVNRANRPLRRCLIKVDPGERGCRQLRGTRSTLMMMSSNLPDWWGCDQGRGWVGIVEIVISVHIINPSWSERRPGLYL